MRIKLTYIGGLKDIVLSELTQYPELRIIEIQDEELYIEYTADFGTIRKLRSITNAHLIKQGAEINPYFISKNKSVLGGLIDTVMNGNTDRFRTFKLSCAGSDSKEVQDIQRFIISEYRLTLSEDADMEIYIGKSNVWEVGVRLTARPLSLREYKVANIKGGLNPTIAYAMNTFCNLNTIHSYLNIFSGSATLLIEAGMSNPNLRLFGFDNNGTSTALAVQNIKKAGLVKQIELRNFNVFDKPDIGMFDCIVADLPFGMQIAKDEDLEKLYTCFVEYSETVLASGGTLVTYTTEHSLLQKIIEQSKFEISTMLDLKVSTVIEKYIYPKIFVCKLK